MNIFVKTKNVPNVLKCKINLNLFSQTWGSQTGGRGWGGPPLGKNSHIFPFFWGGSVPYPCFQIFQEESRHHNSRRAIATVLPQPSLPRIIWSGAVFYWVLTSCISPCWVPCCLFRWAPPLRLAHPNQEEVQRLHLSFVPPLLPPWPWSCSQPSLPCSQGGLTSWCCSMASQLATEWAHASV